jgi:hypothetical protein
MEVEKVIIQMFENRNSNQKLRIKREFEKREIIVYDSRIFAYLENRLKEFYKDILRLDNKLFNGIENPIDFIEQTLFDYITSKKFYQRLKV